MADSQRAPTGKFVVVMIVLAVAGVAVWMVSLAGPDPVAGAPPGEDPIRLQVEVLEGYPHDPEAYTQGLLWHDGSLLESTGQFGKSSLRRVDRDSGEVRESRALSTEDFGEGLARVDDRLIQLTWQQGKALVWSLDGFRELGRLGYQGEGWGLCFDGRHLVMSDGSSKLTFRDPETFEADRQVDVVMGDGAVGRLNELECVQGWVYANIYTTDWIVKIDPDSGQVKALIDASGLLSGAQRQGVDVLNGIAYDPERQVFYLTGKLWPKLFAVRFVEASGG